jgi:ribosomal protein S18 acetylase RimI-like enzyme
VMSDDQRSQTLDIRLAKPSDGDNIARMSRRLIEAGLPWWCWTPKRVAKAIRSPDTIGIVAKVGRKMAGFAVMYFGDENAHLNLLAVEPVYRRRGIGREMVTWLECSCSVAGILRVSLEVRATNLPAISFYRSLGFDVGERIARYYCGQEAAVRMTRRLAASA